MERIDPKTVLPLLRAEHTHRYVWAARAARGHVLDAACGVGYGAPILMDAKEVTAYTGLDCSQEALDYATREYHGDHRTFVKGDVYQLPFADGTFDSIVSLETIEHLEEPGRALAEFARVLKPDGVLLGSVPQQEFEELCVAAYGPNEFHKARFSLENLESTLEETFKAYSIWKCWLTIASVVAPLESKDASDTLALDGAWGDRLGSLLFAATRGTTSNLPAADSTRIFPAVAVVEHERATITWRDRAIRNQTHMIDERDRVILAMEGRLDGRKKENEAQAKLIDERDATIVKQVAIIEDRNATIVAKTHVIHERDSLLATRDLTIAQLKTDLGTSIAAQKETAAQLDGVRVELGSTVAQIATIQSELAAEQKTHAATRTLSDAVSKERDELATQLAAVSLRLTEHEVLVKAQAELIVKRADFIKYLESLIVERDKAIIDMTKMIDQRTELIRQQDLIVADRDAKILSQRVLIEERDKVIQLQHEGVLSMQSQLSDAHALIGSLQLNLTTQRQSITTLERKIASLGGSLANVRVELRQHLSDMQRPIYCVKQATRAMLNLSKYDGVNGREGSR